MFQDFVLNPTLWVEGFKTWVDFYLGANGVLRGPLIAFVAVSLTSVAIYYALSAQGILFGSHTPKVRRDNRVAFEGAGTVWGSDQELKELLAMGTYQKVEGKATTSEYFSVNDDGEEQSRIKVTRWTGD